MHRRFALLTVLCLCAAFSVAAPALAYDETGSGGTCVACHGLESGESSVADPTTTRKGPHGGYSTGTQKCSSCHSVHTAAAGGVMLLPAATVKDTCLSCHDGSGGAGVYGTVLASTGLPPTAEHRVEVTNLIPGGDPDGGDATYAFGAAGFLTCSDCHSPHDSNTVDAFSGDRARTATETPQSEATSLDPPTNRLLRQAPTSAVTSVMVYGSTWCGTCHKGRLSGSAGAINHPVETEANGFDYDHVQVLTGVDQSTTTTGTLGGTNFGYAMPATRTAGQDGYNPICQQCHEDARSVGDGPTQGTIASDEVFTITTPDGAPAAGNNPRFQVFPHESESLYFLIEEDDDLCLNCHVPPQN